MVGAPTSFPFGSAIVTNAEMCDCDAVFMPIGPCQSVPLQVTICGLSIKPRVVRNSNGSHQISSCRVLTLTLTLDTRFGNGSQLSAVAKSLRAAFKDPARIADPVAFAVHSPFAALREKKGQ
jgi:hypothetical protein